MIAASLTRALGGDVEVPDLQRIRADFDAWLSSPPEAVADPDRYVLMQALGLR